MTETKTHVNVVNVGGNRPKALTLIFSRRRSEMKVEGSKVSPVTAATPALGLFPHRSTYTPSTSSIK